MGDGQTGAEASELPLTLDETVRLALRNNRTLLSVRYWREIQKFSLEVREDRYRPQASIGTSVRHEKGSDATADLSIGPTDRIPTGGGLSLKWSRPLMGAEDRREA